MTEPIRAMLQGWRLLALLAALLLAMSGLVLGLQPDVEGLRLLIRVTARSSLLLFSLAFVASAAWRLWPGDWTRWQLRNRRYLGLSFAVSHAIHLAAILAYARLDPQQFAVGTSLATVVLAGIAYVFVFAMAATSFDRAVAWLGARRWKRLHSIGGHYLWLIFLVSFAPRAVEAPAYGLAVALLLAVMGLRLYARFAGARRGATVGGS